MMEGIELSNNEKVKNIGEKGNKGILEAGMRWKKNISSDKQAKEDFDKAKKKTMENSREKLKLF